MRFLKAIVYKLQTLFSLFCGILIIFVKKGVFL